MMTPEELDKMVEDALARATDYDPALCAERVEYRNGPGLDLFIIHLKNGLREVVARENLQGLRDASLAELTDIELLGCGSGIWWTTLDCGFTVEGLLQHRYGNRHWMAELGRRGGASKSPAKSRASRANGVKGGRPRRPETHVDAA